MERPVRPRSIRIAPSAVCGMGCPICPVTTGDARDVIGEGVLNIRDFAALLQSNPGIASLEFCGFGEILRNPMLPDLLRCAREHRRAVFVDSGTNLDTRDSDLLESLVRFGVRRVTCSIDGATQEVYRQYRRNGDLGRVLKAIRTLNTLKARRQTVYPRLTWQFIVFGHNEHEIPLAREMARGLGMSFRLKVSWDQCYSPVRDWAFVYRQHRLSATHAARRKHEQPLSEMRTFCHQLWEQPQVNWDGRMLGCCRNYWGEFGGNVFEDGLEPTANSEGMRRARAMLLGVRGPVPDVPCATCSVYSRIRETGDWLARGPGRSAFAATRAVYHALGGQRALQRLRSHRVLGRRARTGEGAGPVFH